MSHIYTSYLLISLIFLILLSAFFSSAETALMAINKYRLRHKAQSGHKTAQLVQKLLERPDRLLGIILIGNTFANILASSVATLIAIRLLGDPGVLVSTLLLTLLILIFAEITPKTIAAMYPEQIAFLVVFPLWILLKLLYPMVWVATTFVNCLLKIFGIHVSSRHVVERLNKEELRTVVAESRDKRERNKDSHTDMMLSVLDLQDLVVDDVMVPRSAVVGIDLNHVWDRIINQITKTPYSQLPVYYGSLEKVIGFFDVHHAIRLMSKNRFSKKALINATREPYFIPEGTSLQTQLLKFREKQTNSALVVDEYGDILGLVTVKDIVEEIVGELEGGGAIQALVKPDTEGGYWVSGSVSIRDLNKMLHWHLPEGGPVTLSGLIVEELEMLPEGHVSLVIEKYRIEVMQVKGHKILKTHITPLKK